MNNRNIKVELGAVQETLILPLWARAKDAEKKEPILGDTYARNIVSRIDYDFSKIETKQTANHQLVWPIRAYNFDSCVREFLAHNKSALVINIGAGLDTTFQRVDNGKILWINIDLPDVAALRQKADIVVFVRPACLTQPEAVILGTQCDAVLLVVELGATRCAAANEAANLLRSSGCCVLGAVVTDD